MQHVYHLDSRTLLTVFSTAVLFVVDSCDSERFVEAHAELAKLMCEKDLRDAALLVLANKQVGSSESQ